MQDIFFPSLLVGLCAASVLNVATLLVMRYIWKWNLHTPVSMEVIPPIDRESKQRAVIETGQGAVTTEVTHLDDLLPLRGPMVFAPKSTDRYYVRGKIVLLDLAIAWPLAKGFAVAVVCLAGLWFLADANTYSASLVIGLLLAVPAWSLLFAIRLAGQAEKMASYSEVLERLCSHNNSLQARRP